MWESTTISEGHRLLSLRTNDNHKDRITFSCADLFQADFVPCAAFFSILRRHEIIRK